MLKELAGVKRIVVVTGKTDLRRGIPGLSALVRLSYGRNPLEIGTLFLFCGNRRDRIKGLILEDDGWLMLVKRVSDGVFQWPRNSQEARDITPEQFALLMDGFTLEGTIRPVRTAVKPQVLDRKVHTSDTKS